MLCRRMFLFCHRLIASQVNTDRVGPFGPRIGPPIAGGTCTNISCRTMYDMHTKQAPRCARVVFVKSYLHRHLSWAYTGQVCGYGAVCGYGPVCRVVVVNFNTEWEYSVKTHVSKSSLTSKSGFWRSTACLCLGPCHGHGMCHDVQRRKTPSCTLCTGVPSRDDGVIDQAYHPLTFRTCAGLTISHFGGIIG